MSVYALSFHEQYACRHSGACCTAGWLIPVEQRLLPLLGVHVLVPDSSGTCAHFDRRSRLCEIQREHGEDCLPVSCYQFPRRALIDDRGTFVALSNFCPTAAALLYDSDVELAIVESPAAFPERRLYEGLDACGHWPPLVRPGLLFDLESYSRWEAFIVSTFADRISVETALGRIAATAEALRVWTPEHGPFDSWVTNTLQQPVTASSELVDIYDRFRTLDGFERLRRFVPEGLTAPQPLIDLMSVGEFTATAPARAVQRYLASKAFASWSAYEGRGIRTLVAELFASELVLRVECERARRAARRSLDRLLVIEAIRQSDLLLMHLIDRPLMVEWLGEVEAIADR